MKGPATDGVAGVLGADEMWQWETQGYCIARGVMDEAWLREANDAIDQCQDRVEQSERTSPCHPHA